MKQSITCPQCTQLFELEYDHQVQVHTEVSCPYCAAPIAIDIELAEQPRHLGVAPLKSNSQGVNNDQQIQQQAISPEQTYAPINAAPVVPKWYATLTIMGPLCATLLLIGGGVTYWIINNKKVEKIVTTHHVEVIKDESVPLPPEPELVPNPLPLDPPEPTPQMVTYDPVPPDIIALPEEATIRFEFLRVDPGFLQRHPELEYADSKKIYDLLMKEKGAGKLVTVFDEIKTQTCKKVGTVGVKSAYKYFTDFDIGDGPTMNGKDEQQRNTGNYLSYSYRPLTQVSGTIRMKHDWVYLAKKLEIEAGGKDAWMPQFRTLSNNTTMLVSKEVPILASTALTTHDPKNPQGEQQWIYYLFITLKE